MMMKKYFLLILAFLMITATSFAQELEPAGGWYVRIDAGWSDAREPEATIPEGPLPADLGSSPLFGGGLGLTYVPGIRMDLTFTYRSGFEQISGFEGMPAGQADFRSLVTLLSLYLDFYQMPRVTPYGGFGLGFSRNELGRITIANPDGSLLGTIEGASKMNFAYQLCLGVSIQMTNRILLDVGYHFLKAGDYESEELLIFPDGNSIPGKDLGKFGSHEIILSLQYVF
jgi:opacity protein-like surface antigen